MKKALFVFTFLLFFFLTWSRVYASDDILLIEDEIEKYIVEEEKNEEEKKEDISEDDKQDVEFLNNTKATIILNNATYIYFTYDGKVYYWQVSGIEIGKRYNPFTAYYYVLDENGDYFIRGSEGDVTVKSVNFYRQNTLLANVQIYGSTSNPPGTKMSVTIQPDTTPEPAPEPTPDPDPVVSDNEISVSFNSVSENLVSIEKQIISLRNDFDDFKQYYLSTNQVVSNNLIKKKLSDYTVAESISLISLMLGFGALLVWIINKSILSIRRRR